MPAWHERITWVVERFEDKNMSDAGRRWKISPQAVAKLRSGQSYPRANTLAVILRSYPTLDPYWLLLGKGERERSAPVPEPEAREALGKAWAILNEAREKYALPIAPIEEMPKSETKGKRKRA